VQRGRSVPGMAITKRDRHLGLRLTKAEYEALADAADRRGMAVSNYVRIIVLPAVEAEACHE